MPHIMDRRFPAPYVNYTEAVIETEGDLVGDWEVFAGIAERNNWILDLPGGPLTTKATDDEALDLAFANGRISMQDIRDHAGTILSDTAVSVVEADSDDNGRFDLHPESLEADLDRWRQATSDDELLLVSMRLDHVLNSLGSELPALARRGTSNRLLIHPDNAADLELNTNDVARVSADGGDIEAVVEVNDAVAPGVVAMSHCWGGRDDGGLRPGHSVSDGGAATSRLVAISGYRDHITGMARQSAIPVMIRRDRSRDSENR